MRRPWSLVKTAAPWAIAGLAIVALLPGSGQPPINATPVAESESEAPRTVASLEETMLSPVPLTQSVPAADSDALNGPLDVPPLAEEMPSEEIATGSIPPTTDEMTAAVPTPAAEAAFVGRQAVNMRVGPSKDTARIATLQPGEPVSVLEVSDGWALVATVTGETGWVYSSYLGNSAAPAARDAETQQAKSDADEDDDRPRRGQTAQVGSAVVVRAGPSSSAERLFVIEPGEQIRIAETRGRWARVVLDSGMSGWVRLRPR